MSEIPQFKLRTVMIEPVVDSASHEKALRRIEELWDAKPGSPEERELDALATLVDAYERSAFPIPERPRADGDPGGGPDRVARAQAKVLAEHERTFRKLAK